MSLGETLRILRQGWLTIVIGVGVGITVAALFVLLSPQRYAADTMLAVSVTGVHSVAELQQGEVFAEARTRTYARLADSRLVQDRVRQRLSDTADTASARTVVAQALPQTSIISIEVTANGLEEARAAADATAAELSAVARDLDGGRQSLVRLVQASPASLSSQSPRKSVYSIFGALLGGLVGFAWATIAGRSVRLHQVT